MNTSDVQLGRLLKFRPEGRSTSKTIFECGFAISLLVIEPTGSSKSANVESGPLAHAMYSFRKLIPQFTKGKVSQAFES